MALTSLLGDGGDQETANRPSLCNQSWPSVSGSDRLIQNDRQLRSAEEGLGRVGGELARLDGSMISVPAT